MVKRSWRSENRALKIIPNFHNSVMCRYQIEIEPKLLHFKQPAGTSRGVYTTRRVWYVRILEPETGRWGMGECAPLPALSCDDVPDYEKVLAVAAHQLEQTGCLDRKSWLAYPSILFGLEMALRHLQAGSFSWADTPFSRGEQGIPINGLVWMGTYDEMYRRIREKIEAGFQCIKLKIGAIDFEQEYALLAYIRQHFSPEDITLRVDANGAFSPQEAPEILGRLAELGIHSIEQPIRAGQWEAMRQLCAVSPIPIALDEELIGVNRREDKVALLDGISPSYIILKPSLHGGISGCEEWMELAQQRGIGYWITSALESNVGLNAIAQWCATLEPVLPQGLGTGQLFLDNYQLPIPLDIRHGELWMGY